MIELEPCPFCGGEATLENYGRLNSIYKISANHDVICPLKKAMWAAYFSSEKEAIEAWNRRY